MKKILIFLLALVLSLGLCACAQKEETTPSAEATPEKVTTYTFPAETTLLGVDISGLTKEDAWAKLEAAVAEYSLSLNVDGVQASVAAKDMDLVCVQDVFTVGAETMEVGMTPDFSGLIRFNEGKLRAWMRQTFNKAVTEATITYDAASDQYVAVQDAPGQKSDPNLLVSAVRDSICKLSPQLNLTDFSQILQPAKAPDEAVIKEALALANKMNGVKLSYVFTPDEESTTVAIPAETIRSFIALSEDGITPTINYSTLDAYVSELSAQYSTEGTSGDFRTSHGSYVGLTVTYSGHHVDTDKLAEDIVHCMQEGISETRTAPYQDNGDDDMAYGGTYVELDLDAQHLWYYKNGDCLVSADIVSGKVAEGWLTPNGVFSVYDKETSTYLEGEDYWAFVNYWMPFYGGYGLHDGTWHSTFGGTVYYYEGSHGCVNMPLGAAATVYENISIGTKVIIYGGASSCPPMTQSFTGTTSYDVAEDAKPFKLDIKPVHSKPSVSYKSSDTKVATVSSDGTVTVKGVGTAVITVTAAEHKYYTSATATVTVKVHSACDENRHKLGDPVVKKEPTCQPGLQVTKCKKCDYKEEKELPAVKDHEYGKWVTITEATCAEEGLKERTCTICKIDKKTKAIPVTDDHTEGDWETIKEPTCVDQGSKELTCSVCGTELRTEEIPATGIHTPGDWETVTPATCTENGMKAKYCIVENCHAELDTDIIEAGHTPGDWVVTTEPTCTVEGFRTKFCTVCEDELAKESLGFADHSFGDNPTCDNCPEPNPNYPEPSPEQDSPPASATTLEKLMNALFKRFLLGKHS